MTDWLKLFADRLPALVDPPPTFAYREGPPPALVIPEIHPEVHSPEVGELLVYDDGDELTVCVGRVYHEHFLPAVMEPREGSDVAGSIVCYVAEFVADVLADRVFSRSTISTIASSASSPAWSAKAHRPIRFSPSVSRFPRARPAPGPISRPDRSTVCRLPAFLGRKATHNRRDPQEAMFRTS